MYRSPTVNAPVKDLLLRPICRRGDDVHRRPGAIDDLKSCLYELVDLLERSGDGYLPRNNKPAEHVGRILTFIARHYAEPITMQDAAREIGYDYHYLSNLLQKSLHTTFRTLLNEYRISHAQNLLLTGEGTIAAVAAECGYDSLCSFNRNFKAITGRTPTEYRERHAR